MPHADSLNDPQRHGNEAEHSPPAVSVPERPAPPRCCRRSRVCRSRGRDCIIDRQTPHWIQSVLISALWWQRQEKREMKADCSGWFSSVITRSRWLSTHVNTMYTHTHTKLQTTIAQAHSHNSLRNVNLGWGWKWWWLLLLYTTNGQPRCVNNTNSAKQRERRVPTESAAAIMWINKCIYLYDWARIIEQTTSLYGICW